MCTPKPFIHCFIKHSSLKVHLLSVFISSTYNNYVDFAHLSNMTALNKCESFWNIQEDELIQYLNMSTV